EFGLLVPSRTVCQTGTGSFTVSETSLPNGFSLADIRCDDGGSKRSEERGVGKRRATLNVDPGEFESCSFVNTGSNAQSSGTIIEKLGQGGEVNRSEFGSVGDPCHIAEVEFGLLVPSRTVCQTGTGSFTVSETSLPNGFSLADIRCDDGGSK